jgi:hypothetical protein
VKMPARKRWMIKPHVIATSVGNTMRSRKVG